MGGRVVAFGRALRDLRIGRSYRFASELEVVPQGGELGTCVLELGVPALRARIGELEADLVGDGHGDRDRFFDRGSRDRGRHRFDRRRRVECFRRERVFVRNFVRIFGFGLWRRDRCGRRGLRRRRLVRNDRLGSCRLGRRRRDFRRRFLDALDDVEELLRGLQRIGAGFDPELAQQHADTADGLARLRFLGRRLLIRRFDGRRRSGRVHAVHRLELRVAHESACVQRVAFFDELILERAPGRGGSDDSMGLALGLENARVHVADRLHLFR